MHVTAGYIRSALSAGARAYVSKSSPCTDVLSALEAVMGGTLFLDSVSLAIQLSQYTGDKAGPEPFRVVWSRRRLAGVS